MSNYGSKLKNALGALLLLGFALGAWAVTITLDGGVNGSVTCTAMSDIAVSATGDVTADVKAGTADCSLGGTTSAPTVPTGGDPGSGVWISGNNYVHDRATTLSELFVPRCVPSQYTNCRYAGGSSRFDTVKAGQVWAMRIPTATSGFAATTYIFGVQRAETGETLTGFDYAISATVGDFNVTSACKGSGAGTLKVYGVGYYTPSQYSPSCPLTPGTRYYLNVRPQTGSAGATQCGSSATNACRYRIVLPSGFPYSP